jgi:glycosyltransferase involved in cell wall biosynthesis
MKSFIALSVRRSVVSKQSERLRSRSESQSHDEHLGKKGWRLKNERRKHIDEGTRIEDNNKKMKTIRVLHLIASRGLYGAEQVLVNLLPALRSSGFDPALGCICSADSAAGDFIAAVQSRGIPVFAIREGGRTGIGSFYRIWEVLRRTGADILHTHGYKATIIGGLAGRIARKTLMSTCHGEATKRPDLATYLSAENIFLRRAFHVFPVSTAIRHELLARGVPEQRLAVVYNGIDDPVMNGKRPKDYSGGSDWSPHLVSVGRLIDTKRFDLAIEAVSVLRREYPSIVLSIAGDGPCEGALRERVNDLGLQDHVRFLGYIKDTPRLYESADIFLLPSETEGSPIVLLEAMAFSLPIVITSVGAIPEMVNDRTSALLIKPGDLESLVGAMRELVAKPELRSGLGRAARSQYEQRFTSAAMASAYARYYHTAAGCNSRGDFACRG